MSIGRTTTEIGADDFTHPTYRAVWALVEASGGTAAGADDHNWMAGLRERASDPAVAAAVTELGVEPLKKEPTVAYVTLHIVGLLELTALRRIADLKSKLQRTNPVEHADTFNRMFGELAALEEHRRKLRDRIVGEQ
jgi:DNA primase